MQKQTLKTCLASMLAIGLVCTSFVAVSPRAQAAETTAIVSAAFQVYGWLTRHMRSDDDPTHDEVLRNQELLKDLELRLNVFEKAIHEAIDSLDKLPDQYREALRTMLDDMQGNRVLALVDEIVQDQVILDQKKVPTIDPKVRLHDLQLEVGALARRSDLNAPILIAAYRYELLLMKALGAHNEEIEQKRTRHNTRLLQVLNADKSDSLAHDYSVGISGVAARFVEADWPTNRNTYLDRISDGTGLCAEKSCTEAYVEVLNICERVSGVRLTDTGSFVDKATASLLQSLQEDESRFRNLQQQISVLWSWEAILRAVADVVPQELQEEKHRRAVRDSGSPRVLDKEVRAWLADIAEITSNVREFRSTHLRQEHKWSDPPTGVECP